ncbi:MAG: transporter [Gammaproteobacteria bacterium]
MIINIKNIFICGGFFGILLMSFHAWGEDAASENKTDIQKLQQLLEEQRKQLEIQKNQLEGMRRRLDTLQVKPEDAVKPPAPASRPEQITPSLPAKDASPVQPVGKAPERPQRPPDILIASEQRGVLTPRGTLIVEPSFQYTNSSVHRVALEGFTFLPALLIGRIDIKKVNRDTYIAAVAARYGITPRLEVEVKIPYVNRSDTTTARPLNLGAGEDQRLITEKVGGENIGDAEFALRYQMTQGQGGWPYLIGNFRAKSHTGTSPYDVEFDDKTGLQKTLPTGSGFWGVQPSLTMIIPSDPAVIFANVSYLWNIERKLEQYGRIDPGNAIGVNFGMGLSLNEKASFSLAYDLNVIGKTKQNGEPIPLSETLKIASLLFGYSYRVTPDTSVNISIGTGVTADAPDMQLAVRVPTAFFSKAQGKR